MKSVSLQIKRAQQGPSIVIFKTRRIQIQGKEKDSKTFSKNTEVNHSTHCFSPYFFQKSLAFDA